MRKNLFGPRLRMQMVAVVGGMSLAGRLSLWAYALLGSLFALPSIFRRIAELVGWSTTPEDSVGLFDKLTQMPIWAAFFMLFMLWSVFFLAPPFRAKYRHLFASERFSSLIFSRRTSSTF